MGNFPREIPWKTAGNASGAGIKLATTRRDGNLIAENLVVAVGRIASRPAGDSLYTYRYVTLRTQHPAHFQRERSRLWDDR